MIMDSEFIRLEDVSFRYVSAQAVNHVSLNLEPGVYGLLGPNGAGKTTLMKILLGFLRPQSGKGTLLGYDLAVERRRIRANIGYMPESDCLIPGMDAVTLTSYLGQLNGMPRPEAIKRAHDVLYYVGLEESRYRQVETYSTGMKQRLKLAQALVHDPRLLLLDEPTSGMDPSGRRDMLDLVTDISRKGLMNIIISSHLLPDIESTCQYVLIMNRGQIVAQERIRDLNREPFNSYEVRIMGNRESFLGELQRNDCRVEENEKGFHRVLLPASVSTRFLFQTAVRTRTQIRYLKKTQTTLEDAFMKAIGESDGD
jgi:ABC-2 type transport system ATP-binding protein